MVTCNNFFVSHKKILTLLLSSRCPWLLLYSCLCFCIILLFLSRHVYIFTMNGSAPLLLWLVGALWLLDSIHHVWAEIAGLATVTAATGSVVICWSMSSRTEGSG
jgi:hypothetical protein